MNIDIENISELKQRLHELEADDVLFIDEDGMTTFAVLPIDQYDEVEELLNMLSPNGYATQVKVAGADSIELTYDEYERIKNQIMETVEKTLCPKPEKLN